MLVRIRTIFHGCLHEPPQASQDAVEASDHADNSSRPADPLSARNLAISCCRSKLDCGLRRLHRSLGTWSQTLKGISRSALNLRDQASKGASGRVIPLNKELRSALQKLHDERDSSPYVITTERAERTSAAAIVNLWLDGIRMTVVKGCSSHSGRRTFITNAARTISTVGGSLRDVQMLAGHRALSTTQRYIEADVEAQKRVVDLV